MQSMQRSIWFVCGLGGWSVLMHAAGHGPGAGVLPYATDPRSGELLVLIGRETRPEGNGSRKWVQRWSFFEGAVDKGETFEQAAAREFSEETCAIYGDGNVQKSSTYIAQRFESRIFGLSTYALYLARVDWRPQDDFVTACNAYKKARGKHAEKHEIVWYPLATLMADFQQAQRSGKPMQLSAVHAQSGENLVFPFTVKQIRESWKSLEALAHEGAPSRQAAAAAPGAPAPQRSVDYEEGSEVARMRVELQRLQALFEDLREAVAAGQLT